MEKKFEPVLVHSISLRDAGLTVVVTATLKVSRLPSPSHPPSICSIQYTTKLLRPSSCIAHNMELAALIFYATRHVSQDALFLEIGRIESLD